MGKRKEAGMIPAPKQIGQASGLPSSAVKGAEAPGATGGPPVPQGDLITPRPRPKILQGKTIKLGTGCGNLYITINYLDTVGADPRLRPNRGGFETRPGQTHGSAPTTHLSASVVEPFEVFCHLGKPGGCTMAQLEALARIISLCLRLGGSVADICKQLRGIKCPQGIISDAIRVESCADAIVKAFDMVEQASSPVPGALGAGLPRPYKPGYLREHGWLIP